MNIIIGLVGLVAAIVAFKRKSDIGFAFVGVVFMFWLGYQQGNDIWGTVELVFRFNLLYVALSAAAAFLLGRVAIHLAEKAKSGRETGGDGVLRGMSLMVGRILQTNSNTMVFTDVNLTRNAFGGLQANTTHDVQVTHNTWLHDLNTNREVNYTGSGQLKARVGHILGTMSWRGDSIIDHNFSTGRTYAAQATSTNIFLSAIFSLAMTAFGWALFPVFALASPLVWAGFMRWRGGALYLDRAIPGVNRLEAIFTYGGGAIYLVSWLYLFNYHRGYFNDFVAVGSIVFVALIVLHQYVVRAAKTRHDALVAAGNAELARLYQKAEHKLPTEVY